jgi:hypothetical protein
MLSSWVVLWTPSTLAQVLGVIKVLQWIGPLTIQATTKKSHALFGVHCLK